MLYEENIYARYLSGELTAEEESKLKDSGEWEALEKIRLATENLTLPEVNKETGFQKLQERKKDYLNSNKSENEKKATEVKSKAPRRILVYLSGVAASLLVMGVWSLFSNNEMNLSASYANEFTHEFRDKSVVSLNAGSQLTYDKQSWNKRRVVKLKGEAEFYVTKGVPFIVETDIGTVEVLGTKFNVRDWDNKLIVECYSGKVKVRAFGDETILTKNKFTSCNNNGVCKDGQLLMEQPLWKIGATKFQNVDMRLVLNEVERQYDVDIDFTADGRTFSGSFTHKNLNDALDQITRPLSMHYTIYPDKKTVRVFE